MKDINNKNNITKKIYIALFFICILASIFVCKLLSSFLLPVIFSIFLSFVFIPIIHKITTKFHMNWTITSIFVVLVFITIFLFLSYFLSLSITTFGKEYPKYDAKFKDMLEKVSSFLKLDFDSGKSFSENIAGMFNITELIQNAAISLSSIIINFIKSFFLVIIYLALILIEAKHFKNKIYLVAENKNKTQVIEITKRIISEVVRYLSIKFFISLSTGLLVYIGVLAIGLDFPILWGFIAFIMNFIPTFGSLFSVIITSSFALMQFYPEYGKFLFVLIYMIAINCTIGNLLEPKIVGQNLGISTFIVVLSLTLFGWIWGFVGMIIAVPVTVIIKIVCENIALLHPIALFLSDDEEECKKNLSGTD